MKKYDLVVIGTGAGGSSTALTCKKEGMSVAIIDKRPFGGTCALRGCDPKKVLVGAAEIFDGMNRMEGLGIEKGSRINWTDLMNFKRTFTDNVPESREDSFLSSGIDTYHGIASLISENELMVNDEKITFETLLIASGAKPAPLNFEGEEHLFLSDDFLELEELPEKIVFVGGGFISFEFAHIAAISGSEVHMLQRDDKPLKNFDQELVSLLVKRSEELGIHVHLNAEPTSIEKIGDRYRVSVRENGSDVEIQCDRVFHGAGRIPDTGDLNLEKGNIIESRKGIEVNEYLQSISNERVYASGDVSASNGLPLTPVAGKESGVVTENIINGNKKEIEYSYMPSIVFTQPKLAIIGMTEEKAKEAGFEPEVSTMDTKEWYTYKRTNEAYAMTKTVTDQKTGKLLGVHILGSNADELINYFALIMKFDLPYEEIKNTIFAYPTSASDLGYLL